MASALKRPAATGVQRHAPPSKKRPAARAAGTKKPAAKAGGAKKRPSGDLPGEDGRSYVGQRDADGFPHGTGRLEYAEGIYEGQFKHGAREGQGEMRFDDGCLCRGSFKEDMPEGWCLYFDAEDNTTTRGLYAEGLLHGPAEQHDEDGDLVSRGWFCRDMRVGVAEEFDEHGGRVLGKVDDEGELTGNSLLYVFPDRRTALVGIFKDGEFVSGRYAVLLQALSIESPRAPEDTGCMPSCTEALAMPAFKVSATIPEEIHRDVSTREVLCRQPLVPDLYELERAEARRSGINPDMEGLFARRRIAAGELCSWYNGLRCTHEEVDGRDWAMNKATITLDAETVLDVPDQEASTARFCACLGHKANHRIPNNAKYDVFEHPRFGAIKAIRAVHDIAPGEEVCCDYGYGSKPEEMPGWYAEISRKLRKPASQDR